MFNWLFKRDYCPEEEDGDGVDQLVLDVHARCICNREALQRVDRCGCFYCLAIFDPQEIEEWIEDDGGDTALCPRCGIDSVPPRIGRVSVDEELPVAYVRLLVLRELPVRRRCGGGASFARG